MNLNITSWFERSETKANKFKTFSLINKLDQERILGLFSKGYSYQFSEMSLEDFIKSLRKAKAVNPERIPPDLVTMRTKFRLKDLGTGDKFEYTLVYPEEADSTQKISILDIHGTCIFGSKKGEIIKWESTRGMKYFQIDEILYQPEASGHFEL